MEAEDLHVPSPVSKAGQARAATVPTAAAVAVVTSVSVLPMPPVVSVPPVALHQWHWGGPAVAAAALVITACRGWQPRMVVTGVE